MTERRRVRTFTGAEAGGRNSCVLCKVSAPAAGRAHEESSDHELGYTSLKWSHNTWADRLFSSPSYLGQCSSWVLQTPAPPGCCCPFPAGVSFLPIALGPGWHRGTRRNLGKRKRIQMMWFFNMFLFDNMFSFVSLRRSVGSFFCVCSTHHCPEGTFIQSFLHRFMKELDQIPTITG